MQKLPSFEILIDDLEVFKASLRGIHFMLLNTTEDSAINQSCALLECLIYKVDSTIINLQAGQTVNFSSDSC